MCFKALFYVFSDRPRSSRQHSYNHNFRRPGDPVGKILRLNDMYEMFMHMEVGFEGHFKSFALIHLYVRK